MGNLFGRASVPRPPSSSPSPFPPHGFDVTATPPVVSYTLISTCSLPCDPSSPDDASLPTISLPDTIFDDVSNPQNILPQRDVLQPAPQALASPDNEPVIRYTEERSQRCPPSQATLSIQEQTHQFFEYQQMQHHFLHQRHQQILLSERLSGPKRKSYRTFVHTAARLVGITKLSAFDHIFLLFSQGGILPHGQPM
jgi:hypothetical protein